MDNRLAITVVLVTLAWMSAGTSAQTTTPPMSNSNMTTAMSNMTTAMSNMTTAMSNSNMTTAMSNMTTAMSNSNMTTPMSNSNMTTPMSNMTTAMNNMTTAMSNSNMTTAMSNMTTAMSNSNMTTPMSNMTTAMSNSNMTMAMPNMTTAMNNMTMAMPNMTTAMNNMTTAMSNMTTAMSNMTTAAPTAAAPLTTNTTVETLGTPISRTGCGSEQLCAALPSDCDPSTSGSCFFLAVVQMNGQNFKFALSGQSGGYVAATLSPDATLGGNDTTYICANNNGTVMFIGAVLNNGMLTLTTLPVNSVKGRVNGSTIQCTFAATVPDSTTRTSTSFSMSVSNGTFNSTSGALGNPDHQFQTNVVDLANPSSNITNQLNSTTPTTATPTTSHAITLQQSLSQGLLIIFGVLGLAML